MIKNSFKDHIIFLFLLCISCSFASAGDWQTIEKGFEIAWFASGDSSEEDSMITVVRVNPKQYELIFCSVSDSGDSENLTTRQWCEQEGLLLAINGGMFDTDYKTHIGFMKSGEIINSKRRNKYKSALAINSIEAEQQAFKIYDLDSDSLDSIISKYDYVMQNLRLIKRDLENRWSPKKTRKWTEAALAEDSAGNALFIICRKSMTMYDFNERILSLPLGIVAAQHLEGGVQTQMYIRFGEFKLGLSGGFESRMMNGTGGDFLFKLPHVIGVRKVE
ncbi:MAG: phosphodiester glycosidase family protein [candidate division Zixibacteria bacterium]|nr:phosphodiester glycosidase family protein [candidate division Zixibacteria bacterium]